LVDNIESTLTLDSDEWRYQQDILSILFKWCSGVTLGMGLMYLVIFFRLPILTTLGLGILFLLLSMIIWGCLELLRRDKKQRAMEIFVSSATLAVAAFVLFMPDNLLLIGMMGIFVLVQIVTLWETTTMIIFSGGVWALLYLLTLALRGVIPLPKVELGSFENIFLYVVPISILVIFILLDRTVMQYLKLALQRSETVRRDLAYSNKVLSQQKRDLEVSEANLAEATFKLQRSNRDLHRTNEELKSFAYIVSHDLRAPLVNLTGFSGELHLALNTIRAHLSNILPHLSDRQKRELSLAVEEDVPEALKFIDNSVARMDYLTSAILKLSRLGRRELYFEPINMNDLVNSSLQMLAHQIEQHQTILIVDSLPEVVADRMCMNQIIGNILANAVAYLDPERPGKIEISGQRDFQETLFKVRDNGRGIAAEDMPKVFEPFRRAGQQDVLGEGMGLAYVQTLVRRHGGQIWCESEKGVGTTFSFTIANALDQNNPQQYERREDV
jgi:signal transduction histidine kinase